MYVTGRKMMSTLTGKPALVRLNVSLNRPHEQNWAKDDDGHVLWPSDYFEANTLQNITVCDTPCDDVSYQLMVACGFTVNLLFTARCGW